MTVHCFGPHFQIIKEYETFNVRNHCCICETSFTPIIQCFGVAASVLNISQFANCSDASNSSDQITSALTIRSSKYHSLLPQQPLFAALNASAGLGAILNTGALPQSSFSHRSRQNSGAAPS